MLLAANHITYSQTKQSFNESTIKTNNMVVRPHIVCPSVRLSVRPRVRRLSVVTPSSTFTNLKKTQRIFTTCPL